ncbi:MAG: SPOR domain-containing protein [Bacteroidaceae bacterium]|nr:SPOR domain-containing protein [Bacteroidaceae bacterium]
MKKYTFATIFCLSALTLNAQETYTEKLQQVVESAGRIILHQEQTITDLVNGARNLVSKPSQKKQIDSTLHDSIQMNATDSLLLGTKVRMNGYRIQVYFGDNSRQGKAEARAAGLRFRNSFPEHSVYVSFISPHWLCRVGDFRTREEAREVLRQIREMGMFREAVVVKSKINARF